MGNGVRRLALVLCFVGVLLAGGLFLLLRWIATDDFRLRVQAQVQQAVGRPVHIGRLAVDIWPAPGVALERVTVGTRPAIAIERIEVRPAPTALLSGRLQLSTLEVRGAALAQAAVDDLVLALAESDADKAQRAGKRASQGGRDPGEAARSAPQAGNAGSGLTTPAALQLPQRIVLKALAWTGADGATTTLDADARLDPSGLPDALDLTVVAGRLEGARARVARKQAQAWQVDVELAGGTIRGAVQQQPTGPGKGSTISLKGQLETRQVELGVLLRRVGPDGRAPRAVPSSPMRGRLDGSTTLFASADSLGALADAFQTRSAFVVRNAVVEGIDLARAVRTVGMSRGGETALDTLRGDVDTRGRAIALRNLVASSGNLSVSGNVAISPQRSLNGRIEVNLGEKVVGKAVGVPLVVGGTLNAPEVTLTRAALAGAAIGSMILPGVGTGAGAALGDKIGSKLQGLFGK